jgi:hypothetical protein
MKSTSDLVFENQKEVMTAFKTYVVDNKIKTKNVSEKRDLFVEWYLIEFKETDVETIIYDLSNHFLFLSEKTIEDIIFKNAKRYK